MPDVAGWQKYFAERFPDGALVTFVQNSVEASFTDDSPQALATQVHVTGVDDEGDSPSIAFADIDTDRQFLFDVDEVEERGERLVLTLADRRSSQLVISPNLTGEQKEFVKTRRKGLWGT